MHSVSERVTKRWPSASSRARSAREIVDLAVEHDDQRAVGRGHRLVAAGEIEDRQPPEGEHRRAVGESAGVVGPARAHRLAHRLDGVGVEPGARGVDGAGDAAHGYGLPTLAVGRTTSPP